MNNEERNQIAKELLEDQKEHAEMQKKDNEARKAAAAKKVSGLTLEQRRIQDDITVSQLILNEKYVR